MPEIDRGNARIWFVAEGPVDAPALLLAHALGTSAELFAPQEPLVGPFRVIRYDARGHGRSTASRPPYAVELLAGDALAVLDAAGVTQSHVCGVSLGGQVAMWLGAHAPARVNHLVLANTGARIGSAAQWDERIRTVEREGLDSLVDSVTSRWLTASFQRREPATVASLRHSFLATTRAGYAGCCAALREADLTPLLPAIRSPVLVIVGTVDTATPEALGLRLRDGIEGARLRSLPGAHLANVECAAEFNASLRAFLGSEGGRHG